MQHGSGPRFSVDGKPTGKVTGGLESKKCVKVLGNVREDVPGPDLPPQQKYAEQNRRRMNGLICQRREPVRARAMADAVPRDESKHQSEVGDEDQADDTKLVHF